MTEITLNKDEHIEYLILESFLSVIFSQKSVTLVVVLFSRRRGFAKYKYRNDAQDDKNQPQVPIFHYYSSVRILYMSLFLIPVSFAAFFAASFFDIPPSVNSLAFATADSTV